MTAHAVRVSTPSVDATRAVAAAVSGLVRSGDIIVLAGELGTGKTVWVQGFAAGLGVTEPVTSPTFTLVRPYEGRSLTLLHADVYRLETLSEVVDLGLIEQVDDGGVACIEWGDLAAAALPADFLEVRLDLGASEDGRTIVFRPVGTAWLARHDALREAVAEWVDEQ